jgi:light-regulated signal transduction histidine kinase (bacteriophytochrome)
LASDQEASPAFGAADLSNCEREQIHLAGSIQPHGALLLIRESDCVVVQASVNAAECLGVTGDLLGMDLRKLEGNLCELVRSHIADVQDAIPVAVRCHLGDPDKPLNALLHHPPGGGLVVELERSGPLVDFSAQIELAIGRILASSTLQVLCDESARIVKELTGYDRVMVYRFDDAGHGEVFSETKKPELEAFLGNRYPASDIPQIARRLYERNRVRLLADIEYTAAPLEPRLSPISGEELDMSLCFLRSASPIHIQYLKNMGVAATLVVSLMVGGRLWGLISCHNYSPRLLHFEMRAVCELLGEVIGTRIAALESFLQGQGELSVRRLEQRMIENISREGDWRGALFDTARSLLIPLNASGAALLFEGQILSAGDVPGTEQIRDIGKWLESKLRGGVFSTSALSAEEPAFASLTAVASGLVGTSISSEPNEMLIWFRAERVQTVTWGGNPFKPPSLGDDPSELSPRRSFAQWHQVVEGTSDPWTTADLLTARLIGASVTDVILQFRSVQILIAQDQLNKVLRQVQTSDQPVVVADAQGRVINTNAAFDYLLETGARPLQHLDELPPYFADPEEFGGKLSALRDKKQPWRGETHLERASSETKSLLVRADPVMSSPDRTLGFVLLFTDLTERKAAEAARRKFQESILHTHRTLKGRIDSKADLALENLMSAVVENAQLAAMEITDGLDTARMPAMLESVRTSVARTAEVLDQLSIDPDKSRS